MSISRVKNDSSFVADSRAVVSRLLRDTKSLFSLSVKGKGLNSIPVRFALMSAVLSGVCFVGEYFYLNKITASGWGIFAVVATTIGLSATVTFLAADKMARGVRALRASTIALAEGDFDTAVNVECACEVGGLADSFRAMVDRFNRNILHMNILAYSDPITGLPNRAVITHILSLAGKASKDGDCQGALLFIDLDGFKRVNDVFGHEVGDELLRHVSARIIRDGFGVTRDDLENGTTGYGELCDSCPQGVVFARFAGDEFVALLPNELDQASLEKRVERIVGSFVEPFMIDGNEVRVGASVGIARMPIDTTDPDQLLGYADIAMYSAKEAGRGQYRFFDAALKEQIIERTQIETALRSAIETNALMLHFQPKVDTRTMELRGVEALVRWEHPEKGMIPPIKFISIAEDSGLILPLGSTILRLAIIQARAWFDQGTPIPVAINISPIQFEQPGFVEEILGMMKLFQIDPSLIEIEITESMAMSDVSASKMRLEQLQKAGVSVAVDDFGTGYSNLSQLARLSFNTFKIDKSIIDGIGETVASEAIVASTVQMARSLGYKVVAEGVETLTQAAFLTKIGCNQIQGYLIGRPMPAGELENWRRKRAINEVERLQSAALSQISA
jgi:two-component system CheB/CheR fusion protein